MKENRQAYVVIEAEGTYQESWEVIFADQKETKRMKEDGEICERHPEFDEYKWLGFVPARTLIENYGWSINCTECETPVDKNNFDDENDTQREAIYLNENVFCCLHCFYAWQKSQHNKVILEAKSLEIFNQKFPNAEVLDVMCLDDCHIRFRLPHLKYVCEYNSSKPDTIAIPQIDEHNYRQIYFNEVV